MKKRIVCFVLSLILLVGVIPAGVITASAAGRSISEDAITILKQLEGYSSSCSGGYIGYGTKCPKCEAGKTGTHTLTEQNEADVALREKLKELDKAVNAFASKNSISLKRHQHDALVLFSFQNGTAWTTGTGDFQRAIAKGATGDEFLNLILKWDGHDGNLTRRMIEANMYLSDVYSSSAPTKYVRIKFNVNGGKLNFITSYPAGQTFEYWMDYSITNTLPKPSRSGYRFLGWITEEDKLVTKISRTECHDKLITAYWQDKNATSPMNISFTLTRSQLASKYVYESYTTGTRDKSYVGGTLKVSQAFVDKKGVYWVKADTASSYYRYNSGTKKYDAAVAKDFTSQTDYRWFKVGDTIDDGREEEKDTSSSAKVVLATVTNEFLRRREKANIYATQNGTYYQGDKIYIAGDPIENGSFQWGAVLSDDNSKIIGYVALMYTDYYDAKDEAEKKEEEEQPKEETVVARAVVTVKGYVNVRDGAGTDNNIVGALREGAQVDLYQTKYVNGHRWGRYRDGWFCLSYAKVTNLKADNASSDVGFASYVFTGKLKSGMVIRADHGSSTETSDTYSASKSITLSNILYVAGEGTWAKAVQDGDYKGWVQLTDDSGDLVDVDLTPAKYKVTADNITVREQPNSNADRVDTLVKGVEFNVTKVVADATNIWGYADKVGEGSKTYSGWINLSGKYVQRVGVQVEAPKPDTSDKKVNIATVVDTPTVRVRDNADIYARHIGDLTLGTQAKVLEGPVDGWYRLDIDVDNNRNTDSWVYHEYLKIEKGTLSSGGSSSSSSGKTGRGIISNTGAGVNVRPKAGQTDVHLGKILPGTTVDILETEYYGTKLWGRVEQGWICMDYVTMIDFDEIPGQGGSNGSNGSSGSGNTVTGSKPAVYTGKVTENTVVYKETDTTSEEVTTLSNGDPVTIHELLSVKEVVKEDAKDDGDVTETTKVYYWARVNDGYIRKPAECIELDTLNEDIFTLTASDRLEIYLEDDLTTEMSRDDSFTMEKGDQVKVTKLQIKGIDIYGQAEYDGEDGYKTGWVKLSNLSKGAITITEPTTPPTGSNGETLPPPTEAVQGSLGNTGAGNYIGKLRLTEELRVRKSTNDKSEHVATLKAGSSFVITETAIENGMAWGKCESGWVYLYYVDLTPVGVANAYKTKIVSGTTVIYEDSNGSKASGSTYVKQAVVNIYEEMNNMYKTDMGWIRKGDCL